MALNQVGESRAEKAASRIEQFLSRSIPVRQATAVDVDEVEARTSGRRVADELPEYGVYVRLKVGRMTDFETLETRIDVDGYVRRQLEEMEMSGEGPDIGHVFQDFPPAHIDKPLVFYVECII